MIARVKLSQPLAALKLGQKLDQYEVRDLRPQLKGSAGSWVVVEDGELRVHQTKTGDWRIDAILRE